MESVNPKSYSRLVALLFLLLGIFGCKAVAIPSATETVNVPNIEDLVQGALRLYYEGRYSEAAQQLEAATLVIPKDSPPLTTASLYAFLALLYEKLGNVEKARAALKTELELFHKLGSSPLEAEALAKTLTRFAQQLRMQDELWLWDKLLSLARASHGKAGEAVVILNIANAYLKLGDFLKASPRAVEALQLAQEAGHEGLQARASVVVAGTLIGLGRAQDAKTLLEASLVKVRGNAELEAMVRGQLAQAYAGLGQYDRATQAFQEAMALARASGLRDVEAKVTRSWGMMLARLEKIDEAIELLIKAVDIQVQEMDRNSALLTFGLIVSLLEKAGRFEDTKVALLTGLDKYIAVFGDKEGEAEIRYKLANVYHELGLFSAALTQYGVAFHLYEQLQVKEAQVNAMLRMALVYRALNDLPSQYLMLQAASKLNEGLGNLVLQASISNQLAGVLEKLGDITEAGRLYLEALELDRKVGYKPLEANQLSIIGSFYQRNGDYTKALQYFTEGTKLAREIGDKVSEGFILNNIAVTYMLMGRYGEAVATARTALTLLRTGGATRSEESTVLEVLALALLSEGNYEAALDVEREWLNIALESGSAYHIQRANTALGALYLKMGRYAEAVQGYKQAIESTENIRINIPGEAQRLTFFAQQLLPYEGVIEALYNLYLASGPEKSRFAEEALYFAELSKARTWAEELSRARISFIQETIPLEVLRRESVIRADVLAAYVDYSQASSRYRVPEEELRRKEQAWRSALDAWNAFLTDLRRQYPHYAALRYPEAFRLGALAIQEGEIIVAYKVGLEWSYGWVMRRAADRNEIVKFVRLPVSTKELEKRIEKFLSPFRRGKYERVAPDIAADLFEVLLKPLLGELPTPTRLVVISDDVLHLIPFEALIVGFTEEKGDHKPLFLGDLLAVNYYPSATILTINRRIVPTRLAEAGTLLAVGDPVYDTEDERLTQAQVSHVRESETKQGGEIITWKAKVRQGVQERGYWFDRLKHSGAEVLKISRIFENKPGRRDVLVGLDASESQVKAKDLERYRYVHFAVHGILMGDVPYVKEPALALGLELDGKEDGFLTMSEVSSLKLKADLVTLSACDTGLGFKLAGEGIVGLSRAFMYAGARAVLVSLWEIADESTALLMEEFYRLLDQGIDKGEALAKAKRYLRGKGYENPFFWAPFVLIGD